MGDVKSWSIEYDVLPAGRARRRAGAAAPRAGRSGGGARSPVSDTRVAEGSEPAPSARRVSEGQSQPQARAQAELRPLQARRRVTTGLFDVVPSDGNPIQVVLLVSSFSEADQSAVATVNRYGAGGRETVLFRAIDVPAGGGARVELEGLAGSTIEVIFSLPSEELLPSVAVTKTFIADGAVVLQQLKTASGFVNL